MKSIKERISALVDLIHIIKDKNLRWQAANQEQQIKLSQARTLAENDLAAQLTRNSVALAHEIELLKTRHATELAMLKTRCHEDIKEYQHYLAALELLRKDIQTSFAQLPEAIALTIHHHAKSLLNTMWETHDFDEKIKLENQLILFMATVHEETTRHRAGKHSTELPEHTLRLINQSKKQYLSH